MRVGNIERVKRQALREAVADNLDTIRGLPPRGLRPARRTFAYFLRRAPLFIIPLMLAGFAYLTNTSVPASATVTTASPRAASSVSRVQQASVIASSPALLTDSIESVSASAFPLSVHRVVLDAGHGGTDPGASSSSNVNEKTITLDIARRLSTMLRKSGFEVVVTRGDDRLIPLRERAHIANGSSSDIFVSIHVNSIPQGNNHGVETYYLGPTNDPTLTKLAAAENLTSGYALADLRKLLDRVYADVRRDESHRLASAVQNQLFSGLRGVDPGLENWGVKRAPFIVLVATDMPAILAEVGCLSNEREAEMLRSGAYREQIAQALFHGIHAYASANDAPQRKGT
ncbi:MAG: N-acetylmuramoyl-L-alanine amidase [Thermoanaerobaculia bacterium]|jgi:N-acetylmuramoyl-L-alanine amidase|nr:N-acetylmuramoyl-L-alanine amidase [Thermoanaerobaculia bacterium]